MEIKPPILQPSHVTRKASAKGARGTTSGFGEILEEPSSGSFEIKETFSAVPTTGIGSLITIQGLERQDISTSLKHAQTMLDMLDELRLGLLSGHLSENQLQRLSTWAHRETARSQDPKLQGILNDINLRVQVELAKLS